MNVTIFGTGYVGLVTGTCLAQVGHHVTCVDIDAGRVEALQHGVVPIHEPGLAALLQSGMASGCLSFTTDAAAAVEQGDILMIAVGTPQAEDGSADLAHVLTVARTIGGLLTRRAVVVVKSTVPVGTVDRVATVVQDILAERGMVCSAGFASNPEFLKEGDAVNDFMRPDRIVVGASEPWVVDAMRRLYAPFNRNHDRVVEMDVRSAELTKYAANAMLATKISFMNEIAAIAERVGADVEHVRRGIGSDPRIGWHFIYPGAGFGGSCFPKDVRALAHTARANGVQPQLLDAVGAVNHRQQRHLRELIRAHYPQGIAGRTFAVWGLAFKPDTDDMREASSRVLLEQLWEEGARVRAYDPAAMPEARRLYGHRPDLLLCDSANTALAGADALVLVTEWREFRGADPARLAATLRDRVVFDGRNLFDPAAAEAAGLAYYGIGRGRSLHTEVLTGFTAAGVAA